MDVRVDFVTDVATLAMFDPQRISGRVNDACDWWCAGFLHLPEVQSGAAALVNLGGDGAYRLRVTDGPLTSDEHDYAKEAVRGLGMEVVSGRLVAGPGERLPGGGEDGRRDEPGRGQVICLQNGSYLLDVYLIAWDESPRWWREDDAAFEGAPPDLVAVIRPRPGPFAGVTVEPRLLGMGRGFLFESPTRVVGPQPGMVLRTRVRKGAAGELCLKDCGPCAYKASLVDYSHVAWKDTIRLRVVQVDREARRLLGEFVEKVQEG